MKVLACPECHEISHYSSHEMSLDEDREYICRPCGCIFYECRKHGTYTAPRPCPMPPPGHNEY